MLNVGAKENTLKVQQQRMTQFVRIILLTYIYSIKIFVTSHGRIKELVKCFVGTELLRKDVGCQVDKNTVYF